VLFSHLFPNVSSHRQLVSESECDLGVREVVEVRVLSDDNVRRVASTSRPAHASTITHCDPVVILTQLVVFQCAPVPLSLRHPALTAAGGPHASTPGRVPMSPCTTARHKVARHSTELGVDDQVQHEVDGKVRQQEKVGEFGSGLERPVGARSSGPHERDDVRRSDEDCKKNDQSDQRRRDPVSRVHRLLIASVQRLHANDNNDTNILVFCTLYSFKTKCKDAEI